MAEVVDELGQAILDGKDAASFLWQVPDDVETRDRIAKLLKFIQDKAERGGRREMPQICRELQVAIAASPSPQQVDILQDGFDRLHKLWQAARSGLGIPGIQLDPPDH